MEQGPLLINILGVHAPALSLAVGLISVILMRLMLVATVEPQTTRGYWFYQVSLTLLLTLIVFTFIIDRQLGPGLSLIVGVGAGASGVVIIDIFKKKANEFFERFI